MSIATRRTFFLRSNMFGCCFFSFFLKFIPRYPFWQTALDVVVFCSILIPGSLLSRNFKAVFRLIFSSLLTENWTDKCFGYIEDNFPSIE